MGLFSLLNAPLEEQKTKRVLSWVATLVGLLFVLWMFCGGGCGFFDGFVGIPVLLFGVVGTIATHRVSESAKSLFKRHRIGFATLGAVLVAHLLVLGFSVPLFFIPAGTDIRPMGWAFAMGMIAIGTFVVVVPTAVVAITKEHPSPPGLIGLILGLTPFWFSALLLRSAVWMNGLHPSP